MRVLLLGGTSEARTLAARMHPDVDVISSLAGRVPDPALPVGEVRIGGFGGVDGMRSWLIESKVDAVVDATHPYAATITSHAAEVCGALGLPLLVVARPAWPRGGAVSAASDAEAVEAVRDNGFQRVFLTTGRSGVEVFKDVDAWFLIRAVTAPDPHTLPSRHQLVLSRGPYRYDDELRPARGASHRLPRDQEQRRRYDAAEAGCGCRAWCSGGDGRSAAVARRGRRRVDGRRCRRLGQFAW